MTTDASMRGPAVVTLALYGVLMAVIGFFPTPVDRAAYPWITKALGRMHDRGLPAWFSYHLIEFGANIALFIPFGILAAFVVGRRRIWLAVVLGLAVTLTIEIGQWMLLPERVPSALDVLANTTGAAIGAALGYGVLLLRGPGRSVSPGLAAST